MVLKSTANFHSNFRTLLEAVTMLHKFLVFAFLLTCWTPFAHAQASPPISIQKQSDVRQGRRVDYAGRWNSYGSARHVYVLGFMDGDANGSERAVAFSQGRSNPGAVTEWLDSTYIFAGFT